MDGEQHPSSHHDQRKDPVALLNSAYNVVVIEQLTQQSTLSPSYASNQAHVSLIIIVLFL